MKAVEKFKIFLNNETVKMEKMYRNIFKGVLLNKSLQSPVCVVYDFEIIPVETEN